MRNDHHFPPMTEDFDRRVRQTLEHLPAQPRKAQRTPLRRILSVGIAAALCIGGTAFAVRTGGFPLLFPGGGDAPLTGYIAVPAADAHSDENDRYRMTVESVLFDEYAGAGLVSLHLVNKAEDGVMPFELAEYFPQYQNQPALAWSRLSPCYPSRDGQLDFNILYGDSGFCGSRFYLDQERSTENSYYIEGVFIPSGDYTPDTSLRLAAQVMGQSQTQADGMDIAKIALQVTLPDPQPLPSLQSADGAVTLSQIGLRVTTPLSDEVLVDRIRHIAVKMKDGTEQVVLDEESNTDQTLYAMGFGRDAGYDSDTSVYVLARTFDLTQVQAVVLNGTEYPLS